MAAHHTGVMVGVRAGFALVSCLIAPVVIVFGHAAPEHEIASTSQARLGAGPKLVEASDETEPTSHRGDAADDPAIWVHPNRPGRSLVIGNDKLGALEVYNIDGSRRQRITTPTSFWGNVDVRQRLAMGRRMIDVVAAMNNGIRLFTVNARTRTLALVTEGSGASQVNGEGLCLYHSQDTGDLFAFVITRAGVVRQFRITDSDRDGRLEAAQVRQLAIGSEAEGCVADDATGALYISQEDKGLLRLGAEPGDGVARVLVDRVGGEGHLVSDVEGVTLVSRGRRGYVIASAQNVAHPRRSYFVVYSRRGNRYVSSFRITAGSRADGCQRTDGVAAYAGSLGPTYPRGIFICQDGTNTSPHGGNQNFKFTRLDKILDLR